MKLQFGGEGIPETAQLVVEGDGLRALGPFAKGEGEVEIAADAAPGPRLLRLAGPKGGTSGRPFAVGTLPERAEQEPNDTLAKAERVESLPVTLNGALPTRTDVDLFRVSLKRGECLVVAGESRALGAPTNLLVRIRDPAGRELLVQMDHRTRDPLLGFTAPEDGHFLVELQEVMNNYSSVNADYVYRVTLTTGPWLDTVFPPGARRGTTARLAFSGWNLPGGRGGAVTSGARGGATELEVEVAIPAGAPERYLASAGGAPNRVAIAAGAEPETIEDEPNGLDRPQAITAPVTVNGRFGEPGDLDVYRFIAKKGETLQFTVTARALDSFADAVLQLRDAAGKTLATADDERRDRDPELVWTAPSDGEYRALLRDVASGARGGPGFFYRLSIAPPVPELRLTVPNPTLVLKRGEKAEVTVTLTRARHVAPVALSVEGLPPGVTAVPVTAPEGASQAKLVLVAVAEAPPGHALVRIVASSPPTPKPLPPGRGHWTTPHVVAGMREQLRDRTAAATATWVLATDRSGTLAQGTTDRILLVVPEL